MIFSSMNEILSKFITIMTPKSYSRVWPIMLRFCKISNTELFPRKKKCIDTALSYLKVAYPLIFPEGSIKITKMHDILQKSMFQKVLQIEEDLIDILVQNEIEQIISERLSHLCKSKQLEKYVMVSYTGIKFGYDIRRHEFLHMLKDTWAVMNEIHIAETNTIPSSSQQDFFINFVKNNEEESVKRVLQHIVNLSLNISPHIRVIIYKGRGENPRSIMRTLQGRIQTTSLPVIKWTYFENSDNYMLSQPERMFIENKANTILHESLSFNITGLYERTFEVAYENFFHILNTLCLRHKYPGRLCLQDILSIQDNMHAERNEIADLPFAILRTIMSSDFRFRDHLLDYYQDDHKEENIEIHPSDVFLCIYLCSDMELQKVIAQKMALCHLSIPFIYPNFTDPMSVTVSKWPARNIAISETAEYALSTKRKRISFIRVGECKKLSKSKIVNGFMKQHGEHNIFFHKDCPLGGNDRLISNGVVEISWFEPSTQTGLKKSKGISEALTIFNLRGDGEIYSTQVKILCDISDIIILFLEFDSILEEKYLETLGQIYESGAEVLILTELRNPQSESKLLTFAQQFGAKPEIIFVSTFDTKKGKERNSSDIRSCLYREIESVLRKEKSPISLEKALESIGESQDVHVDEDNVECQIGKQNAKIIVSELHGGHTLDKLPLQGEQFGFKISRLQKEMNKSGKFASVAEHESYEKEIINIRIEQIRQLNSSNLFIAKFVEIILSNIQNQILSNFTLSWLDSFFNAYQRLDVESERIFTTNSIGLEHCFREIGQIYEAFITEVDSNRAVMSENTMTVIQNLPTAVAQLLVAGQPFELMDGDAGNVPINWIRAVLKALQNKLGNFKVFAISVLGIQSSGKSTMLNTMFGLKFAVSAGRCTQGMYMQLIPVVRARSSLQFDYALVIDTEGLRAPERSENIENKHNYDNELATLVTGLSDMVIVNVKGETIADLENVLQIAVHGLIRLKQANPIIRLKKSCMLVHQNVSAEDAADKLRNGHQKTIKNLDTITKCVAIDEGMQGIARFTDVLTFDATTSIVYVCDFWHGTPPMTHINPEYSSNLMNIKEQILNSAENTFCLCLNQMTVHLEALWDGVLKEDFVFSFRNCIETQAYKLLVEHYNKFTWEMEETITVWYNFKAHPTIEGCESVVLLEKVISKFLYPEMEELVDAERAVAISKLVNFIDTSDFKLYLNQWKENKINSFNIFAQKQKQNMENKIQECKTLCEVYLKSRDLLFSHEKDIIKKAKVLATRFKEKNVDIKVVEMEFEQLYNQWLTEIKSEFQDISSRWRPESLKEGITAILYEKFHSHRHLLKRELAKKDLDSNRDVVSDFKILDKIIQFIKKQFNSEIERHVNDALNETFDYMSNQILSVDKECTTSTFLYVLNKFLGMLRHDGTRTAITIPMDGLIQITLRLSRHCYEQFVKHNRQYFERRSLQSKLRQYKPKVHQLFLDTFYAKTKEDIVLNAANAFCTEIQDFAYRKILRDLPHKMKDYIFKKYEFSKHNLIKEILTDLATGENIRRPLIFEDYIRYVRFPDLFAKKWLTDRINSDFFSQGSSTRSLFLDWACKGFSDIANEAEIRANEAKHSSSMSSWIESFCMHRKDSFCSFSTPSFSHLTDRDISDFIYFNALIKYFLRNMRTRFPQKLENINQNNIEWYDYPPYESIFESLWGCREKCPWCNEPCQNGNDHNARNEPHRCIQHRPVGILGRCSKDEGKLSVEFCNFQVDSTASFNCGKWCGCSCDKYHKCSDYKTYMPEWDIAPSSDLKSVTYWAWFMKTYSSELAKLYNNAEPDIPDSWQNITKEDAVRSLNG